VRAEAECLSRATIGEANKMKLQLHGLTLQYGDRYALQDLTVSLEGQIIGLLGANASGKTSLLQILAGTSAATEGQALIDGMQVRSGRRPGISYLPQDSPAFPFWQHPKETLSATFMLRGVKGIDPRELLAGLGLEDEDRRADEFSGGMKQKLRIAQALAHAPRVLIMDEPTTGLDIRERFRLLRLIERLRSRVSIVFSAHQPDDVASVCDQVLILRRGRAVASGTPGSITAAAGDRVFEWTVPSTALPADPAYEICEAERSNGTLRLRVVGEQPPGGTAVAPRLKDAYVWLTRDE
jgi:ABC-type multidrug transport system ATPase subunit